MKFEYDFKSDLSREDMETVMRAVSALCATLDSAVKLKYHGTFGVDVTRNRNRLVSVKRNYRIEE